MRSHRPFAYAFIAASLSSGCRTARDEAIAHLVAGISEAALRKHVAALAAIGPRPFHDVAATRRTVEYIEARLREYGYAPRQEPTGVEIVRGGEPVGYEFVNVLAERRGVEEPRRVLELAAHYDTVEGSPGADDNSSGVAALLEVARVLAEVELERTVRFAFFALEESGMGGSRVHVRNLVEDAETHHEGTIVLEMVGYSTSEEGSQSSPARIPFLVWPPATGDFITVVGNFSSGALGNRFERAADTYMPELAYYSANRIGGWFRDALRSDHAPYWRAGLRAVMLTDTANFRNPHYHQSTDTPETLDYAFLRQVAMASAATALEAAGLRSPAPPASPEPGRE